MQKTLMFTYLGENGTITTPIYLEGAYSVKKYSLVADEGKVLTRDGVNFVESIYVSEDEVSLWREVPGQK